MYTKEELENLIVKENISYTEIGRRYGVSGEAIRKAAKKFGIKLPQRRKINPKETFNRTENLSYKTRYCAECGKPLERGKYGKYCSAECFQEHMRKQRITEWKNNPERFAKEEIPQFIRGYLMTKYGCKCQKCGWGETNPTTGKIPLEVHHVDGNCTNNSEENLMLLCPNCHSLTPNSGSLNSGNSKRYKLKKYKNLIK